MKDLIDFYDDSATEWEKNWYDNETLLPYLKEFMKLLPDSPRVLDLCCGAGYESMRLKNLGANVVGVDLSEKSLEIARRRNPKIPFYKRNMLTSYSDLGEFDGIACIAGIVHIWEEDLVTAFTNMYEVVKDGGYIFIVVKDGDEIKETSEFNGVTYARNFIQYTLDKLCNKTENLFKFIKELESEDKWRFYIFKKV